ncbi:hypothetical protein LEP1GSC038_1356 [Leptospira weilii str. 2006001855]|uniref:Uncharacterized protein n=1 Tax=Leptospira weilii str. 2006001855 TaxID=996804 RepID=M6FJV8_9LEPT|nr:hypothetical protein LEP1GSC038_1356 [Leptospira weilii str. 2006001855]
MSRRGNCECGLLFSDSVCEARRFRSICVFAGAFKSWETHPRTLACKDLPQFREAVLH